MNARRCWPLVLFLLSCSPEPVPVSVPFYDAECRRDGFIVYAGIVRGIDGFTAPRKPGMEDYWEFGTEDARVVRLDAACVFIERPR
jgi:hypothetical protein